MEGIQLEVGGRRLEAARIAGDEGRRAIILLHEGLGSVQLWRDFPQQLHDATGREVISFSRFGHGASQPPPRPRTPAFFHEEALEVLPDVLGQVGAAEPLLVGHSDGASIALIYAAHHRLSGLALLAPHVFVEDVTVAEIENIRHWYREGDLRDRLGRRHADPDAVFWGWCDVWLDPLFRDWTLDAEAARLEVPTLLVQGVDDPYGSLAQLDRIEAAAPVAVERLHVSGGHSPHLEARSDTVAALTAWQSTLP